MCIVLLLKQESAVRVWQEGVRRSEKKGSGKIEKRTGSLAIAAAGIDRHISDGLETAGDGDCLIFF